MIINIKPNSTILPGQTLEVEDWICEKNGIDFKECIVDHETEKAYMLKVGDRTEWVPKSQCQIIQQKNNDLGPGLGLSSYSE
ncbi:hypothetical protein [Methanosalsum natronophilum]|uniref:hypothetical protein n=1 Tax=Methanosalsum natronophilum TaxID=768733 RepID=UPI00216A156A|nr:hypothetical protein [Methanosalsum natronophilum]MCS3924425.1 hypothetical protein [Methanosalsum natronophilum]